MVLTHTWNQYLSRCSIYICGRKDQILFRHLISGGTPHPKIEISSGQTHKQDTCPTPPKVHAVMSDSLRPHALQPTRFLCPWNFSGKNTGVGCHFLLQGIFSIQGLNPGLQHRGQILYHLSHQGRQRSSEPGIKPAFPALAGGSFTTELPKCMEKTKWIKIHENRGEEHLALLWLSSGKLYSLQYLYFPHHQG